MTTGLGKGIGDAMKDTGFEEFESEDMLTAQQEAEGSEFLAKLDASAIKDPVSGQDVIPDMVLISEFHSWLYKNKLRYDDGTRAIIERSWAWVEKRRKYEAEIGILESESLCWMYSREQIRKIEANPADESLYGLVVLPRERQKAIRQGKEYHEYQDKVKSGYFDRLAAESLSKIRNGPNKRPEYQEQG